MVQAIFSLLLYRLEKEGRKVHCFAMSLLEGILPN
jgi:hypothetical protein